MQDKPPLSYGVGFRSLAREIPEPVALTVSGALPSWLKGTLLRTGPSKFEVGARTYNHWFDGLAMLHQFAFADGSVTYANRFLKSNAFCAATKTGRISYGEFATDPCRTLFGRVMAIFDPKLTDNCCVNISDYARQAVAFTETSIPIRIAPKTLETLGVFGYRRALRGQISTAHPHYDAVRRCHYNYVADLGMSSIYRLVSIGDNGKQRLVAKIPVKQPAYMHSFGMSADHLVLTEFPLRVNPIDLRLSGKPFIQNYRWEPEQGLVFHVVEKDTGKLVRIATADAAFAFHHVNSFAHGDGIDVDASTYPDATSVDQLYLAPLRASTPITATGRLMRYRIPFAGDVSITYRTLPIRRSSSRASITSVARESRIALFGAPASPSRATFSIASSKSTPRAAERPHGTSRGFTRASRSSFPRLKPRPRMTAWFCPSCSTRPRTAPSCSCLTRRA